MRRAVAAPMLVLALMAAGCGTTTGDPGAVVSAGPRLPGPGTAAGLGSPGGAAAGAQPPVSPQVRPFGPIVPQPGPQLPQMGPNPPGDPPSAHPNALAAMMGPVSPALADLPDRAYVPNSDAHTITVIDPHTFEVVGSFRTGTVPHHITPSWDMSKLYVNNTTANTLTVIDPREGRPGQVIPVIDPYNLYFTPDGTKAIVVAERLQRLDFRDPQSWQLIKSVPIPGSGVDHMDFSADGRYLIASDEFSGHVVKVDTERMEVTGEMHVGGLPIDVKMSPDGSVFYVANQGRHGVSVIDPQTMTEIKFLPTERGAHGLNYSRDTERLFVSNRLAGSISVIDVASREVVATWRVGGSPDMLQVSRDGKQLWVTNRFHGSVSVIDTADGHVIKTIRTGAGAHGVSLFPQPGRYSVGHNGVYR